MTADLKYSAFTDGKKRENSIKSRPLDMFVLLLCMIIFIHLLLKLHLHFIHLRPKRIFLAQWQLGMVTAQVPAGPGFMYGGWTELLSKTDLATKQNGNPDRFFFEARI